MLPNMFQSVTLLFLIFCHFISGGYSISRQYERSEPRGRSVRWGSCSKKCGNGIMSRSGYGQSSQDIKCAMFPCQITSSFPRSDCCEVDLVFVVDNSGSMREWWPVVTNFMTTLAAHLRYGHLQARVGIVIYDSNGDIRLQLVEGTNFWAIQAKINALPAPNGLTNMAAALNLLDNMFTTRNGDRCKVCNVVVVISDNDRTQGPIDTPLDTMKSPPVYNAKFFGVAFMDSGSNPLLDEVASDPDSYYSHKADLNNWWDVARRVAHNACQACQHCPRR